MGIKLNKYRYQKKDFIDKVIKLNIYHIFGKFAL